ncbi:MAG: hypothetical protein LHV69_11585, partial [Elusimicrobia bacterium]|nr:hypothetical protein [Candidatus Obscuribacterium magneticum]
KVFLTLGVIVLAVSSGLAEKNSRPTTRADIIKRDKPFVLAFPGVKGPIPYERYGRFIDVGTPKYKFEITDRKGLAAAAGEGIFPNTQVTKDPRYREYLQAGKLEGRHWDFVDGIDAEVNFYKWANAAEDPGVKQFYTSVMLERLGLIEEAVKGFYSIAVHFPRAISYTYYNTPWYIGPSSLDRAEQLLRRHSALKMALPGGRISIQNRFDNDPQNDFFTINPGKLVKSSRGMEEKPINLKKMKVLKELRGPKTKLVEYENHHWQMFVDGKPFVIKAISYSVTPVGRSPDRGTWNVAKDWQVVDVDSDTQHDGLFESYVDLNGNDQQDPDEPTVGDAKLLKDMGVNTIRAYHHIYDRELFRKLYKDYGFYVMCGDLFGTYGVGSGAKWEDGTDYSNPTQQENLLKGVREMVEGYKDEPYILMWVIGNENVFGVANNSNKNPEAFFELVNRAAKLVHEIDPTRPVGIANGDVLFLDIFAKKCPDVDIVGTNSYRGEQGFGRHFFQDIQELMDKPVMITEFGCSAYAEGYPEDVVLAYQAMYLANNWEDLAAHMAGRGVGNALGGVVFEYLDGWWKANSDLPESVQKAKAEWYASRSAIYKNLQPLNHDTVPQFGFPFLDGWSYEEWYGIMSQGSGKGSPFCRVIRPAYNALKEIWNKKEER